MPNGKQTCDGFVLPQTFRLLDSAAFLKCDCEAQFRLFFRIATGTSIEMSSYVLYTDSCTRVDKGRINAGAKNHQS